MTARTTKRPTKYRETPDFAAMISRMIRAHGRRVAMGNLDDLKRLVEIRDELDEQIGEAARGLYDEGHSWGEIGRILGMTRQSARERFGR
jgi:hypothetical protein